MTLWKEVCQRSGLGGSMTCGVSGSLSLLGGSKCGPSTACSCSHACTLPSWTLTLWKTINSLLQVALVTVLIIAIEKELLYQIRRVGVPCQEHLCPCFYSDSLAVVCWLPMNLFSTRVMGWAHGCHGAHGEVTRQLGWFFPSTVVPGTELRPSGLCAKCFYALCTPLSQHSW